ncbi:MAG: RNA methyltransferase [Planctomycetes bacterium]|nr:RNA methyltransferase [Planctomycetota bacterium]
MDIQSTKNPLIKRIRAIRDGDEKDLVAVEGVRLVEEAIDAGLDVELALVSPKLTQKERGKELMHRLAKAGATIKECDHDVLARASGVTTPQGVLIVAAKKRFAFEDLVRGPFPCIAVAVAVRDPGNVGAIVRSAEAAGASGFVAIEGSADPWKEKALRGSAGSIFRLPSISELSQDEFLRLARKHRLRLVATQMHGGTPLWEADFGPAPIAFLFGAEGPGLPPQLADRCDLRVSIPMATSVESLNVSVAASLVLFEQRRRMAGGGR